MFLKKILKISDICHPAGITRLCHPEGVARRIYSLVCLYFRCQSKEALLKTLNLVFLIRAMGEKEKMSGCGAAWFSAPALGAGGRWFESTHPDF